MNSDILNMLEEIKPEFDFNDSEDFVMDGLLDSFDIITLISMLEEKYGISIDGLDIVPENFSSVDSIVNLVIKSGGKAE
ncbi:MAG: acyl carrier protein [Clostridiales bacterium]|nr:acyl carrier protein [Clostridiales bacterium]